MVCLVTLNDFIFPPGCTIYCHHSCNAHNTHLVEYCLNSNKFVAAHSLFTPCVWPSLPGGVELRRRHSLPQMQVKERKRFLGPINIFLCSGHRETILLCNQDCSLSMYCPLGGGLLSESRHGDHNIKIEMNILHVIFLCIIFRYFCTYVLKKKKIAFRLGNSLFGSYEISIDRVFGATFQHCTSQNIWKEKRKRIQLA